MRLVDGRYRCTMCGTLLEVPSGDELRIVLTGPEGGPRERVLIMDEEELHRCEIPRLDSHS